MDLSHLMLNIANDFCETSEVIFEVMRRMQRYLRCPLRPFGAMWCKKQLDFTMGGTIESCKACCRLLGYIEVHKLQWVKKGFYSLVNLILRAAAAKKVVFQSLLDFVPLKIECYQQLCRYRHITPDMMIPFDGRRTLDYTIKQTRVRGHNYMVLTCPRSCEVSLVENLLNVSVTLSTK